MIEQASVGQLRRGELTRRHGHIAITMRYYPRGLRKELRDEYLGSLAPDKALFKDFKRWQPRGHDAAFQKARYDERFWLGEEALAHLARLAALSRKKTVYLICQCEVGERCHREMLMLLARRRFRARIGKIHNAYPDTRILRD